MPTPKIALAAVAKPAHDGDVIMFEAKDGDESVEGFVIRFGGKYYAYVNECRHLPLSLDGYSGIFFSDNQKHLLCVHHGALYQPQDGLCIDGPCVGQSLRKLTLVEDPDRLRVYR